MDVNDPDLMPPGGTELPCLNMTVDEAIDLLSKPDGTGVYEVAQKAVGAARKFFPEIPKLYNRDSTYLKKVQFEDQVSVTKTKYANIKQVP
jgi:hypothetical protein